jgi:hypothetical protein
MSQMFSIKKRFTASEEDIMLPCVAEAFKG